MRILTVDDSATMRRIISKILRSAGYDDIVEAGDGAKAMVRMRGVDLVLLDWNMPVMDGISFVHELRRSPQFNHVPIIMVTTEGADKEVMKALKAGVNDYIIKPFTPDVMLKKIEGVISKISCEG